ncbi:MAG: branched-chain-amino-acid transaminase [Candidatus Hermodarchaeota archaeon]|nr:branched-chain-amino-acid transaminase [Candidatus Hermodarchaeota archaeon]
MVKDPFVYIDGKFISSQDAKISVFDHGLLYGDGIFEGIRVYDKVVFMLDAHLDRLYHSAKAMTLTIPLEKAELKEALLETLRRNGYRDSYIRLLVTRGKGDLGVNPNKCPKASVIIINVQVLPMHGAASAQKGISTIIASIRRQAPDATTHEIKSLNYLNSVLATIEANRQGADDAIILDQRGFVAEATGTTLIAVRNGVLHAPPLTASILDSITRRFVMGLAEELGYLVLEADMTPYQLLMAEEVFLCGTMGEITPVRSINGHQVGDEVPGPITQQLLETYSERRKNPKYGTVVA